MADYTQQGLYQEGNSLFDDIFAFGDLEVQNINVVGIITAKTFSGVDATSLKDNNGTIRIQATTTGATHSGRAVFDEIEIGGKVYDGDGSFGSPGQVLSSDGTDTAWVNAGSLSAGAAAQVAVVDDANSNSSRFLTFVDASSGNNQVKTDSQLKYNPSTNTINTVNIAGNVTGNVVGNITGNVSGNVTGTAGTFTTLDINGDVDIDGHAELDALNVSGVTTSSSFVGPLTGNVTGNLTGNVTGNINGQLTGAIQTAAQTNITSVGTLTGLTVDGNLILDSTSNYLHIKGALYDKDGQSGSNGEVLVSTGSQVDWQNPNTLTASNSIKITITENDTNSDFPITFSAAAGQSGGNTLLSDNQFTYNASSNTVTAGTFSGSGASLTSLPAGQLTGSLPVISGANLTNIFVSGMIIMWNSTVASIPTGWVLCDGNNSTPDLRNRFVVGAGTGGNYSPGDTGGANSVTLTLDQIPAHTHTWDRQDVSINNGYRPWPANNNDCSRSTQNTGSAGGGQSHENRPPYYALMFIMKL